MKHELILTPHGRLLTRAVEAEDVCLLEGVPGEELHQAFAASSAEGLLRLMAMPPAVKLPSPFAYWRDFARRQLDSLCHLPETAPTVRPEIPAPTPADLAEWLLSAPPMTGTEYLSQDVLMDRWQELGELVAAQAQQHPRGLREWLKDINPAYRLLGKVTFHLAENKKDAERPFAFLATYAHRMSEQGDVRHLPLSNALQEYSGAGNRNALASLLSPIERAVERSPLAKELLESRRIFHALRWTPDEAYRFLLDVPGFEEAGIITRIPDWWRASQPPRAKVSVSMDFKPQATLGFEAMLECSANLTIDGEPLSREEAERLRAARGLVFIKGKWIEADADKLNQALEHWRQVRKSAMDDGISFVAAMRMLAGTGIGGGAAAAASEVAAWSSVVAAGGLAGALRDIGAPERMKEAPLPPGLIAELRPYQHVGVNWLRLLHRLRLGACLADDMGLGKTLQVLAVLLAIKEENAAKLAAERHPALLIVPASLIANWKGEVAKFAPSLRLLCAHPAETPPAELKRHGTAAARLGKDWDAVITTYAMAGRLSWLADVPWALVVADEAQALKNPAARQTRAVKALPAACRFALTGTPVENRLSDLWSIYDFICPGLLGSQAEFAKFAKGLATDTAADYAPLRALVRPYLLRRLKTDRTVIPDLPEKTEVKAYCPLTPSQALLYQDSVRELAEAIAAAEGIQRRGLVLAFLMRLKQICNHPSHWLGDGDYAPGGSGKFSRLAAIVEEIAARQEKVLVFTQFREITDPLARFLATCFGREGIVLHGDTPIKARQALVNRFQEEDGPPFFVLSLKAGGTGLNLTAATHVIHFDRWWNPAVENQATDRAFRIGQKRNVLVHKFICRGTIEERIDALIEEKKGLSEQILADGTEKMLTEMSNDELLAFVALDLKSAAMPEA